MSIIRVILSTYKWYHPAFIPNQADFQFVGKLIDNTEVNCKVVKGHYSYHIVRMDNKDFDYATLKEWRNH